MALQKIAAIGGIVSTVIAVATFVIFLDDRDMTSVTPVVANEIEAAKVTPEKKPSIPPTPPKVAELRESSTLNSAKCVSTHKLKQAYKLAKEIYYNREKDKALSKIIDKALCEESIEYALTIANSIYYNESRDSEYFRIVKFATSYGNMELANQAVGEIYYNKTRDAARQYLIDVSL